MEEIGWKTGRKDVPENTGSGHPTESGVPAIFTCIGRTRAQDNKYVKNSIPFFVHGREKRKS